MAKKYKVSNADVMKAINKAKESSKDKWITLDNDVAGLYIKINPNKEVAILIGNRKGKGCYAFTLEQFNFYKDAFNSENALRLSKMLKTFNK